MFLRAYLGRWKYVDQNYLFIEKLCVRMSSVTRVLGAIQIIRHTLRGGVETVSPNNTRGKEGVNH